MTFKKQVSLDILLPHFLLCTCRKRFHRTRVASSSCFTWVDLQTCMVTQYTQHDQGQVRSSTYATKVSNCIDYCAHQKLLGARTSLRARVGRALGQWLAFWGLFTTSIFLSLRMHCRARQGIVMTVFLRCHAGRCVSACKKRSKCSGRGLQGLTQRFCGCLLPTVNPTCEPSIHPTDPDWLPDSTYFQKLSAGSS